MAVYRSCRKRPKLECSAAPTAASARPLAGMAQLRCRVTAEVMVAGTHRRSKKRRGGEGRS